MIGDTNVETDRFTTTVLPNDSTMAKIADVAEEAGAKVNIKEQSNSGMFLTLILSFLPVLLMIFFFYMMMGQGRQGGGGGRVMNFGKSKAKSR